MEPRPLYRDVVGIWLPCKEFDAIAVHVDPVGFFCFLFFVLFCFFCATIKIYRPQSSDITYGEISVPKMNFFWFYYFSVEPATYGADHQRWRIHPMGKVKFRDNFEILFFKFVWTQQQQQQQLDNNPIQKLLCLTRKCMRDDVISTSLSSWEGEEEKSRASFNVFVFFSTNGVIVSFLFYREILLFFLYRCMRKEKKQEESVWKTTQKSDNSRQTFWAFCGTR